MAPEEEPAGEPLCVAWGRAFLLVTNPHQVLEGSVSWHFLPGAGDGGALQVSSASSSSCPGMAFSEDPSTVGSQPRPYCYGALGLGREEVQRRPQGDKALPSTQTHQGRSGHTCTLGDFKILRYVIWYNI